MTTSSSDSLEKGVTATELLREVTTRLINIGEDPSFQAWRERARMSQIFNPGNQGASSNPVTELESYIKGEADDQVVGSGADFLADIVNARLEADDEEFPGESREDALRRRRSKIEDAVRVNYDAVTIPTETVADIRQLISQLTNESLLPFKDAQE